MAAITGITGSVTYAGGYTDNIFKWSLEQESEDLDVTPFGATGSWKTNIAGLRSWRGTYEVYTDDNTALTLVGDQSATLVLQAAASRTYTGTARVQAISQGTSVDGADRTITFSFTGTGAQAGA